MKPRENTTTRMRTKTYFKDAASAKHKAEKMSVKKGDKLRIAVQ